MYRGEFTVKTMLSISDRFTMLKKQKELLGDNKLEEVPVVFQQRVEMLSELSGRVISAPQWWGLDGSILSDDNVVVDVFVAAVEAESDQLKKIHGDGQEAKKDLEKIVDNANKTEVVAPEKK